MSFPVFTWRGTVEVKCIPNMALRGSVVVIGGQEVTVQFSLNVLAEYFLTVDTTLITVDTTLYTVDNELPRPVSGMFLKFRGKDYRVLSAALDPTGVYYSLILGDKHSGR